MIKKNISTVDSVKQLHDFNQESLEQILTIERDVFPPLMQSSPEEIKTIISNKKGIHLLVFNNKKVVGYLSAVPHNDEYPDLIKYDKDFALDDKALYIDSIAIKPGHRGLGLARLVFQDLIRIAKQRGFDKIGMHVRVSTGLSQRLQGLSAVKFIRRLDNWYNFGEPFDYLEISLDKKSS